MPLAEEMHDHRPRQSEPVAELNCVRHSRLAETVKKKKRTENGVASHEPR